MGILTEHRLLDLAQQSCHNILIYSTRGLGAGGAFKEKTKPQQNTKPQ